jgi:Spy/CpxP family protein refolding chaperone
MMAPASSNANFDRLYVKSRIQAFRDAISGINAIIASGRYDDKTVSALQEAIENNKAAIERAKVELRMVP